MNDKKQQDRRLARKLADKLLPSETSEGLRARYLRYKASGKKRPSADPEVKARYNRAYSRKKKKLQRERERALAKAAKLQAARERLGDYRLFPIYVTSREKFILGELPFVEMLKVETECRAKVGLGPLTIQERLAELEERLAA